MKFVKGISLFFVYPLICLAIGYLAGLATVEFFYPGSFADEGVTQPTEYNEQLFVEEEPFSGSEGTSVHGEFDEIALENDNIADGSGQVLQEASGIQDTLNADTEYVILEKDLRRKTLVETIGRLPAEYIGLDRELFLSAMEEYEMLRYWNEMTVWARRYFLPVTASAIWVIWTFMQMLITEMIQRLLNRHWIVFQNRIPLHFSKSLV